MLKQRFLHGRWKICASANKSSVISHMELVIHIFDAMQSNHSISLSFSSMCVATSTHCLVISRVLCCCLIAQLKIYLCHLHRLSSHFKTKLNVWSAVRLNCFIYQRIFAVCDNDKHHYLYSIYKRLHFISLMEFTQTWIYTFNFV